MLESIRVCSDVACSNDSSMPVELQLQEGLEKTVGVTSEKVRNYIHDDLAFSILTKLPLKSLKRFGCVRKSWSFENPNFFSIFRNNFISNQHSYFDDTSLLLQHGARNFDPNSCERFESMDRLVWPNPFQQEEPKFIILDSGSITGILCLYQLPEKVVLWNPATNELRIIPPSPNESAPHGIDVYRVIHGFGYDQVNDDYKLIRFVIFIFDDDDDYLSPLGPKKDPLWEIYSLRNNSWRKIDGDEPASTAYYNYGERLYINGMCHWWGFGKSGTCEDEVAYFLSSFDLSKEAFFTTPASVDKDDNLMFYLLALNGYIALISWYLWGTTFLISILGELGEKESWTKLYIVGPLPYIEQPIGAWKNGKIFFRKEDDELVLFDLNTQLIEELGVKVKFGSHILIYKENFLPFGE